MKQDTSFILCLNERKGGEAWNLIGSELFLRMFARVTNFVVKETMEYNKTAQDQVRPSVFFFRNLFRRIELIFSFFFLVEKIFLFVR